MKNIISFSQVYLVAGSGSGGWGDDSTEIYSSSIQAWKIVGLLPFHLRYVSDAAITYDNVLYIFGGQDKPSTTDTPVVTNVNTILKFDKTTESWMQVGQMAKPRSWHGVSIVDQSVMVHCSPLNSGTQYL